MQNVLEKINEVAKGLRSNLTSFINPLTTPFFTVLNYGSLSANIKEIWLRNFFLIISVVYFFLTFYLAFYNILVSASVISVK
jgi:hypothetical protein